MAAKLLGKLVDGAVADVHSTQRNTLGIKCKGTSVVDDTPAEFIYLKGVASTAIGSWIVIDEDYGTALLDNDAATTAEGKLAVAQAAVDSTSEYGWYQIYGKAYALALTAYADNAQAFASATAGSVDDDPDTGNAILGAISRTVVNETTFLATFELDNPRILISDDEV
jgi:hypothetical protein